MGLHCKKKKAHTQKTFFYIIASNLVYFKFIHDFKM